MSDTSLYGSGLYGDGPYGLGDYVDPQLQLNETATVDRALTPLPPPVFTGMKLQNDVALGDLVLNRIDENNVIWVCTEIEGWWTHPDPEVPDYGKGWGDGSYDASGRWMARQINLQGVFLPPAPEYVAAARAELIRATALVRTGAWLRTAENPTKASYVRLSGRPEISTVSARGRTEFSVGLRAADPIKYSWNTEDELGRGFDLVTLADGETKIITNSGEVAVNCYMVVAGPHDGPAVIRNVTTNQIINLTDNVLSSTDTLEIDTFERSISLNGSFTGARSRADTVINWIRIDPGANTFQFDANGASAAALKVYFRSGWLA